MVSRSMYHALNSHRTSLEGQQHLKSLGSDLYIGPGISVEKDLQNAFLRGVFIYKYGTVY